MASKTFNKERHFRYDLRVIPTGYKDKITSSYGNSPFFIICNGNNTKWKVFDMAACASNGEWSNITHIHATPSGAEVYAEAVTGEGAIYLYNNSGWNMTVLFMIPSNDLTLNYERSAIT